MYADNVGGSILPIRFAYRELNSQLGKGESPAERTVQNWESLDPDFPENALSDRIIGEQGMLHWLQPHLAPESSCLGLNQISPVSPPQVHDLSTVLPSLRSTPSQYTWQ